MRARRTDANQAQIVAAFRKMGFSVADTSRLGCGFPDLVVGKRGVNVLIEIKDGSKPPSARKLTPDESEFIAAWRGRVAIVKDIEDAMLVHSTLTTRL